MGHALVIGGGPAGLMAAEQLARAGHRVQLVEAMPTVGRKLLMAGKSGLNLTRDEPTARSLPRYGDAARRLAPILETFGNREVRDWAHGLGQDTFAGTSGRVFPVARKASPLLRAWLGRLNALGVAFHTRWRWTGWTGEALRFATASGTVEARPDACVLALGGASWPRLGSDGAWVPLLAQRGVAITPLAAANAGLDIDWSQHMRRYFGAPVKNVRLSAGTVCDRGEFVISARGLEGSGIYAMSRPVREGARLCIDLLPGRSHDWIISRLGHRPAGETLTNRLRKALKLPPAKLALLREFDRPPGEPKALAARIKALPVRHRGLRPIEEAISSAGGIAWHGLDEDLMLAALPGVFAAGEMLDWEAPTGGHLLTGCLSTGRRAGRGAARWLGKGNRAG